MATSPVTLDFSKAQPVLDFSKAQPIEKAKSGEPTWVDRLKNVFSPEPNKNELPKITTVPGMPFGEALASGLQRMGSGAMSLGKGEISSGLHEILTGAGTAMSPTAIPVAAALPGTMALAVGGGAVGGKVASSGAEFLGASPDQAALAGDVGGLVGGLAGGKLANLPSKSHAGELFQSVKGAAGTLPVDANNAGQVALEAQRLAQSGGRMPKVLSDFLRRVTDPNKPDLNFSEARDFYSNATRLSADEANRLTPVMKRQVGEFTRSLNSALSDAAEQAGKLDEYLGAMKEFRNASQISDLAKAVATKYLPRGVATYAIYKLFGMKP